MSPHAGERAAANGSEVLYAIHESSLEQLQDLSLRPGGFGGARSLAWAYLLGIEMPSTSNLHSTSSPRSGRDSSLSGSWMQSSAPTSPRARLDSSLDNSSEFSEKDINEMFHPDMHQVELDTNRSFILYPVEETTHSVNERKSLQEALYRIILGVLRKRPNLRYFQGYHDIITVLFLTLPDEVVLPSAEKISLHRLRDSMGSGLDPLVGQLRVLKRLLRLADPPYAEILERNSPLPFYALSNLLTLFSHDVPTLPLIQHIFDWLLCREPIAVVWLAAAVILHRKPDVLALEKEGPEAMGMMHAVLSPFPNAFESGPPPSFHSKSSSTDLQVSLDPPIDSSSNECEAHDQNRPEDLLGGDTADKPDYQENKEEPVLEDIPETPDMDVNGGIRSPTSDSLMDSWTADIPQDLNSEISTELSNADSVVKLTQPNYDEKQNDEDDLKIQPKSSLEAVTRSRRDSTSSGSYSFSHSSPRSGEKNPPLPLTELLSQASELLQKYPPSFYSLRIKETFGSQSALYPHDSALKDMDDDEAAACVDGDNVVLPPTQEEEEEEHGYPKKPVRQEDRKRGRMRLGKGVLVRKQVVVAGAVLLLGIVAALYGFSPGNRGYHARNNHKFGAAWVGLLGLGQRLGVGL